MNLKQDRPWADFPYQEYRVRAERTKELMEKHGLDGLILFGYEHIAYYTGWRRTARISYFNGAVIPRDGETVYVAPTELDRAARAHSWIDKVKTWEERPSPPWEKSGVKMLVDSVKELGLAKKTIGLELSICCWGPAAVTYNDFDAVRKNLPDAKFVDAANMIWEQRKVKTRWEIETMRKLGDIAAKGHKAALEFAREGVTERDILQAAWKTYVEEGAYDIPMLGGMSLRAGSERYNIPVPRPSEYRLKRGDQMLTDGGPTYKGYCADIQRACVMGEPSEKVKKHAQQAKIGYEAAMEILKPGTKLSDIFTIPYKAMKKFNREAIMPYTHMGHSIGLRPHELPMLTADAEGVLEPDMVIAVETPGYELYGNMETGWKIQTIGNYPEDMFLITEGGFENLTGKCPWDLWVK